MSEKNVVAVVDKDSTDVSVLGDIGFLTVDPSLVGENTVVVELGTKVKSKVLDKYKGVEDNTDRIAFLTVNPFVIKFHYFDGVGPVQCNGGTCCEMDPADAKVRYLFPIIKYNKIGNGKWKDSAYTWEYLVLSTSSDLYESVIENNESLSENGEDITSVDFNIKCTDADYQKMIITAQKTSLWKTNPELINDLKEHWVEIQKNVTGAIAKDVSEEKLIALLSKDRSVEVDEDEVENRPVKKKKEKYIDEEDI